MKSISPSESFGRPYISVVEVSNSSSNSSDAFSSRDEGSETDSSFSSVSEYSAKENKPQIVIAGVDDLLPPAYVKSTDEYHRRRERNNLAVRKSRDKAKQKQKESLHRLQELTAENKRLQLKAELLIKELVVLKGLFPSIGEIPPPEVDEFLAE